MIYCIVLLYILTNTFLCIDAFHRPLSLKVHLSLVKRAEAGSEQRLSSALYRLVKLSRATRSNLTQTWGTFVSDDIMDTTDRLGLFAPFLTDPAASSWLLS